MKSFPSVAPGISCCRTMGRISKGPPPPPSFWGVRAPETLITSSPTFFLSFSYLYSFFRLFSWWSSRFRVKERERGRNRYRAPSASPGGPPAGAESSAPFRWPRGVSRSGFSIIFNFFYSLLFFVFYLCVPSCLFHFFLPSPSFFFFSFIVSIF